MYDIAIIGAGPAGATLARLIGGQYRTLLVDKRDLLGPVEIKANGKCCGGLLAPDAQAMLSKMGLGLPRKAIVGPQLFSVRAIDIGARIERHYQRFYINMNRLEFERWLLSMIPANVDIKLGYRFKSYEATDDGFKIQLRRNNETSIAHARVIVGADGALSKIRKLALGNRPWPKQYFAIQEWFEVDSPLPYFSSIFDPQITDYYCWTIPKDDHLIIGAALNPRDNTHEKFELLKQKLRTHGFEFKNAVQREGACVLRPVKIGQIATGTDRIALVGEAAGFISPSSAEGFSYAFKSAIALAEALRPSLENFNHRYHCKTSPMRRNLAVKNLKSHVIYNPTLRKTIMQTALASMNIHHP